MTIFSERYLPAVESARALLENDPAMKTVASSNLDPTLYERFLIEFCARAVHMTEPVEGWIRRAGEATIAAGYDKTGQQLIQHAKHEAGHHLMLIEDADRLAARWNTRNLGAPISAAAITALPMTPAMQAYVDLHEDAIVSASPFRQVAIELEIENLAVRFGPTLIEQTRRLLGPEAMESISFIEEHVEVDQGHTALNEKMMSRLLEEHPEHTEDMVATGRRALEIYVRFFGECLARARESLSSS